MSTDFTREVKILPAYDYRDESGDQRGAGGTRMIFILRGPSGAIGASVNTGWVARPLLHHWVQGGNNQRADRPGVDRTLADLYPSGDYVGAHSFVCREGFDESPGACDWLDSGECYISGSYLAAKEVLGLLVTGGSDAVWEHLTKLHQEWIADRPIVTAEVSS